MTYDETHFILKTIVWNLMVGILTSAVLPLPLQKVTVKKIKSHCFKKKRSYFMSWKKTNLIKKGFQKQNIPSLRIHVFYQFLIKLLFLPHCKIFFIYLSYL